MHGALASPPAPVYDSGTFWAGAGATATIAAIVVSVLLWRLGGPRRLVTYSLDAATPLLNPRFRGNVQVLLDAVSIARPHMAILRVQNRSRWDITSGDFHSEEPLAFDLGALLVNHAPVPGSTVAYQATSTAITIGPALIRSGQTLEVSVITEGAPHLTCKSDLANVTVKEQAQDYSPSRRRRAQTAMQLMSFGWFVVGFLNIVGLQAIKTDYTAGIFLVVCSLVLLVIARISANGGFRHLAAHLRASPR